MVTLTTGFYALGRMRLRSFSPEAIALLCALLALTAALFTIFATQNGKLEPTALIKMAHNEPMAELARATDPGFVFVESQAHYDGVYYYAIARDPLLRGEEHTRIDWAHYRYGHPFYGWAARVLSLGSNALIPWALMLLSLAGIAIAAWSASRLSVLFGKTPWGGLLVPMIPGILYAASISTTEAFSAGLIGLVLLAWLRNRIVVAAILMICMCLTREHFVMIVASLALWELLQARRNHAWPVDLDTRIAALMIGPAVLTGWYIYVHNQLGIWPFEFEDDILGAPFAGWPDMIRISYQLAGGSFDQSQIGVTTIPMQVAGTVLLFVAALKALRFSTPIDFAVLALVIIVYSAGWKNLIFPHEILRHPSTTQLLAIGSLLIGPYRPNAPPSPTEGELSTGPPAPEPST